jgi:hypothetical protein
MKIKQRSVILITVVLIAIVAMFALANAAVLNERAYLPAVFYITGTPPHTATPGVPVTKEPTATPVPRHFSNCAYRTGSNATIAVLADIVINGDLVLAVDDEIAVFTPDSSICAGMTPWDGKNIAVTAWGDDTQTEEVDGLLDGEEMMFRIWDKSESQEIVVEEVAYTAGDGFYVSDGIYVVASFTLE